MYYESVEKLKASIPERQEEIKNWKFSDREKKSYCIRASHLHIDISKQNCQYGVSYYDLVGVPVDKDGKEIHSGNDVEKITGYQLRYDTGFDYDDFGHKFRTAAPIKKDGKPVILSVDQFEALIKEGAQKSIEEDLLYVANEEKKRQITINKESTKCRMKIEQNTKNQRYGEVQAGRDAAGVQLEKAGNKRKLYKDVVRSHVGKSGTMNKAEKMLRLAKEKIKSTVQGD